MRCSGPGGSTSFADLTFPDAEDGAGAKVPLSGGRSKDPIDLLKGAGVDMSSAAPIQSALDLFGELLDEMEELMK